MDNKLTEAQKCDSLADRMDELKKAVTALKKDFNKIDYDKLDAEGREDWSSDIVEEILMCLGDAELALDGII